MVTFPAQQSSGNNTQDFWSLGGNTGTTPGTNRLGTNDNQPFELWVNGSRAFRIEPQTDNFIAFGPAPNVIGGSSFNAVTNGAVGATIAGGGSANANKVSGNFGSVGGGALNTASGNDATVGGGIKNTASGNDAVVTGGATNNASGNDSTVAGGEQSTASGLASTVSGGTINTASGADSAVAGGGVNNASGNYSFRDGHAKSWLPVSDSDKSNSTNSA